MRLILTTHATLTGLGLASALSGDIITHLDQKHQGNAYGVEDCPKSICKDANAKLCDDLHTGNLPWVVPIYMGEEPARWSDCEKLLDDIKGDPPKRLFLDGEKHDAGGKDYSRIAGSGQCAIGFKASDGTPSNSFLALSAADADVLFRAAKRGDGGRDEDEGRLYSMGNVTCSGHTFDWVIRNGQLPMDK
ncbi:uncharacterized protein PG986_000509 [Apiospora aurea]|uniref:Ecp2 effector protein domain-containing protein n=1 Tax=Apiospora aurea TaxID=335848 RepID=A0ABR1QU69_9PEZI